MPEERKTYGSHEDADLEVLSNTPPTQFDGHTDFHLMSPWQRLSWLDEAVAFIAAAKTTKRGASSPLARGFK